MRSMRLIGAGLIAAAAAMPAGAAEPIQQVLERATAALGVLDGHGVSGGYLLSVRVKTKVPGEDGPEDTLEVHRVTIGQDGTKRTELVRAVEDGRDVTEERRRRGENVDEERSDDRDEVDLELLPIGTNAHLYAFKAPKVTGGLAVASYGPRADVDDDDLSRGRIAWDVASGDPLWIEAEPVDDPAFVAEVVLRFEFARTGPVLHPSLITTHVRAGIPLVMRVKVDVGIEVSDVRLEPRGSSSPPRSFEPSPDDRRPVSSPEVP